MRRSALLALIFVALASCGDSTAPTVIFGEGTIPPAIPDDFPVPDAAVIGATLIDTINTKSEFEFRTTAGLEALVQSLSLGLVDAGFVVDNSSGNAVQWSISFRRGSLEGSIELRFVEAAVSQGVVRVNDA